MSRLAAASRALSRTTRLYAARRHASSTTKPAAAASEASAEQPAPPGDGPNHRSVMTLDHHSIRPFVQPDSFVAPSASVIGSVVVNFNSAVMYGAVVRGDLALIHVGAYSFIGEHAVLSAGHVDGTLSPSDAISTGLTIDPELLVGDYCTVGSAALLHSCRLEGENVVGARAVVGDGVVLGRHAEILPCSVVEEGTQVPEGEIWGGSPAVKVGTVDADTRVDRMKDATTRTNLINSHAYEFLPVGSVHWEKEALEKKAAGAS